MSWWQELRAAIFRTSPAFSPADDIEAVRARAIASTYEVCAELMERWANLTTARGGKPDWTEFHATLGVWRTSAMHLRGER